MRTRDLPALLLLFGLGLCLAALSGGLPLTDAPMIVGQVLNAGAPHELGTANNVAAVLLAYRGFDTLGELTILFVAATAAGLVLGGGRARVRPRSEAGFILRQGADLLMPFLLLLGAYIVLHGHLTPGGGFQGGAILAAAFFLPLLSDPRRRLDHRVAATIEGIAGALFILIGFVALFREGHFLAPLFGPGTAGALFAGGSLPLLYVAVGLKVGAELAGLMARMLEEGER